MAMNRDAQIAALVDEEAQRLAVLAQLPRTTLKPPIHCFLRIHETLLSTTGIPAHQLRLRVLLNYN